MHDFWRDTLPCPSLWGYISDTIVDMCNELIHNPHWGHSRIFDELSTTVEEQLRYLLLSQISSGTNSFQWYQKSWYLHWQFHRSCTRCEWQSNQSQCSSPISNTRLLLSIEQQNPIPRNEIISLKIQSWRTDGRSHESPRLDNKHTLINDISTPRQTFKMVIFYWYHNFRRQMQHQKSRNSVRKTESCS